MTEKRYVIEEIGNMFRVLKDNEPLTTKFENCDKQDVTNLIAELNEFDKENKELKDKLENGLCPLCGARVSKCGGLQKYKGDLND